jgi:prolyl 4-hydroxylase
MTAVLPPRIASTAFQMTETPAILQEQILAEYAKLGFQPVPTEAKFDNHYNALVRGGISDAAGTVPDVNHAPISRDLFDACYEILTPLVEAWAGCPVVKSWGYGIRSYGSGSVLHLHRDRVDTHVISCIIHVDDDSNAPWPLDFIDHDGKHHQLTFERGQTLFYESLCPHARLAPFNGAYYRNMYIHWRPEVWNIEDCAGMRSRYRSLEDCMSDWRE